MTWWARTCYARSDQGRARTAGVERSGSRFRPWDSDSRRVIWPARRISDLGRQNSVAPASVGVFSPRNPRPPCPYERSVACLFQQFQASFGSSASIFTLAQPARAGKRFLYIAAVNSLQEIILKPLKIPLEIWPAWARDHLLPTDVVAVESTTNTWDFYDGIVALVAEVQIANTGKLPWITKTRVKTDKHDSIKLAKLCAAGLIPQVWVPPAHIREARCLLAHRRRLVGIQTMTRNRLQSLLHRHMLELPAGEPFSNRNLPWWDSIPVSPMEKILLRHYLDILGHLKPLIEQLDAQIASLSNSPEWRDLMTFALQIPGFGVTLGLTILSAIGDISRFESPKKLVGYSGLGASVHASGQTFRQGRITKAGRRDLRTALIEAAWAAVNFDPYWKSEFDRLSQRLVSGKAIVAIARRLLVVLWHVLSKRQSYRHISDEKIASKMLIWSEKVRKHNRRAASSRLFIRRRLMTLGVGKNLYRFTYGNKPRALASEEEALASMS